MFKVFELWLNLMQRVGSLCTAWFHGKSRAQRYYVFFSQRYR